VPEIPDQPRQDQKRSDQQIAELLAEVQRLAALVRTVDLCGTGFVWTDRATGKQHMLNPVDVLVVLPADQRTEIEKIKEVAYRAGREDEARSDACRATLPAEGLIRCPTRPDGHRCIATVGGHLEHPCLCGATFTLPADQWLREKIRNEERRAGREDAARDIEAWIKSERDQYPRAETWQSIAAGALEDLLDEFAKRWRPVDQSGVQPTEEQRAVEEDQKRGEEQIDG
jgi:hypothetical protein